MATNNGAFDDGELEISLPPAASRKAGNQRDARSREGRDGSSSAPRTQHLGAKQQLLDSTKMEDQRLGAYKVMKTLGEGSFGKVKLAVHTLTGQHVALKIISRRKLISRDMSGRVEREIEYLQLLRHPHIIKLYNVIKTATEIIMVLEYAGGEMFDYIVENGKMREEGARRFFQQMICAVEYCHRHKIVHRDLKPENLLLDNDLNVKIADFGLSNIMTDGNFLKTSCGSPNYAAPEVINGKLYAGPEVDVWSCGVILYVLLVGRLPFDDEHIPSLFAKIAKGLYVMPPYIGAGPASMIKRMLMVNPTNRITIQEIRRDEWFNKGLAPYLQLPVEEFIDTGVDPSKIINKRRIAPNAPQAVQEKLHAQVIQKISQTMGYGIKDVEEALNAPEESAITDAYMIVKENKMMAANPSLADDKGQLVFQAPSPPTWIAGDVRVKGVTSPSASPLSKGVSDTVPGSFHDAMSPRSTNSITSDRSNHAYVSKVAILPTSVPRIHKVYWDSYKSGNTTGDGLSTIHADDTEPHPQTDAEKAETRSRLNPHSRGSQLRIQEATKPAAMTPVPGKKNRPTKWQFGIRSRNQPLEAISCIYSSLRKLGASWRMDVDEDDMNPDMGYDDDGDNYGGDLDASGASLHHAESMDAPERNRRPQFLARDPSAKYALPKDPWVIHVRWTEDGLLAAGSVPSSTHNSATDLRRQSISSLSSAATADRGISSPSRLTSTRQGDRSHFVVMHMDIQLFEMERNVYLIDFKCVGYENADGLLLEDKEVTSPFPFLDLASKLIIKLAEAD